MSEPRSASGTSRIDEIVDEFVARYHSDNPLRAEDLVDAHADMAEQLAARLAAAESLLAEDHDTQQRLGRDPAYPGLSQVTGQPRQPPSVEALSLPGYQIIGEIHRGGQGVVYLAVQESTRRKVAVKLLLGGAFASSVTRKRFSREVEIVARLRHPGIITIFDSGITPDGAHFYVMDYIDGQPLNRFARKIGADFNRALELFLSLCDAVSHAHRNGVIHRDLKPQNILVDNAGSVRVLDFGLAKAAEDECPGTIISSTGQVVGTLPYMSPEQARGESDRIDTRTDVYALGVVLYELLCGAFPYGVDGSASDIIQNITQATPQPLRSAWRQDAGVTAQSQRRVPHRSLCPLDDEIQTVVFKAIAKEPQRRYQSVVALSDDLKRYLAGDPIEAKRDSRLYVLRKTLSRHKLGVSIVAAGVGLTFLFGLAMMALYTNAKYHQGIAEQRELVGRKHLYAAEMKLAQQAWQEARLDRVDDLLRRHLPADNQLDLRHFEWYYLKRICDLDVWTGKGHNNAIYDILFSPDGAVIVSADLNGSLRLWSAATGESIREFVSGSGSIWSLTSSSDGRLVASGGNGLVTIWDSTLWTIVQTLEGHDNAVLDVAFSPDDSVLATASSDNTAKLWDVRTGTLMLTLEGHGRFVSSVAFTPDGTTLATGSSDSLIKLWNVSSGELLTDMVGHERGIYSLAFSTDGKWLVSAGGHWHLPGELKLWDFEREQTVAETDGHKNGIWSVEFSPDGKKLVTASEDQTLKLWSVPTLEDLGTIRGHTGFVYAASFSPDGDAVVSSSSDRTVRRWTLDDFDVPRTIRTRDAEVNSVAISSNGKSIVAAGSDGMVRKWNLPVLGPGKTLWAHDAPARMVTFDRDGRRLFIACDETIVSLDAATGRVISAVPANQSHPECFAFSPSENQLAIGNVMGNVELWDAASATRKRSWRAHAAEVGALGFSPDGRLLATAGDDGTARIWDAATGAPLLKLGPVARQAGAIVFSPDGTLVTTGGVDHVVNVWDARTGQPVRTFIGHGDRITALAFTPDGKTLAVGAGHRDPSIRLWDLETGLERATLRAHGRSISFVAFTPDGLTMVTGSADETIKLWSAATQSEPRP
ncbi:MAG: protein kinase domain-containing protein [Planctomycetota bacterium]